MKVNLRPWLSWIEYSATNRKVGGSNPSGRTRNKKNIAKRAMIFYKKGKKGIRTERKEKSPVDCFSEWRDSGTATSVAS